MVKKRWIEGWRNREGMRDGEIEKEGWRNRERKRDGEIETEGGMNK
jgi:hypothetical protein